MLAVALCMTHVSGAMSDLTLPALAPVLLFPFVAMLGSSWRDLYRPRVDLRFVDAIAPVLGTLSLVAMASTAAALLFPPPSETPLIRALATIWIASVGLVTLGRLASTTHLRRARARPSRQRPTLIVGAGEVGHRIAHHLESDPGGGLRPIGFLDDTPAFRNGLPILGGPGELERVVADHGVKHVVLAFSKTPDDELLPLVRRCSELGIPISLVPRLFEAMSDRLCIERLGGLPLLQVADPDPLCWQLRVKYALDRALASVLLIALAPLFGALAALVKLSSTGPVFFRQRRVGRDSREFVMLKFRSMRDSESAEAVPVLGVDEAPGGVESDDRRTAVGQFLRRSGLDELPQLVNVVRGEMSLVGPRPERPGFAYRFSKEVRRYDDRHRVKAGITGLAQVNGLRGRTSISDRVESDNYYVQSWSLGLDAKILLRTLATPFRSPVE